MAGGLALATKETEHHAAQLVYKERFSTQAKHRKGRKEEVTEEERR